MRTFPLGPFRRSFGRRRVGGVGGCLSSTANRASRSILAVVPPCSSPSCARCASSRELRCELGMGVGTDMTCGGLLGRTPSRARSSAIAYRVASSSASSAARVAGLARTRRDDGARLLSEEQTRRASGAYRTSLARSEHESTVPTSF